AANTADIATNTTNIATNTADITTNATNIATNTTDIATNATNIADHIAVDDDTDDTNELVDLNLTTNILTLSNPATGGNQVDLSGYLDNTDNQTASEVGITDAGGNFTSTDVEGALSELAAGSSDDQNIDGSVLTGNTLTIGIENGTSEDVDLSSLDQSAAVAANAANIATNTTNIATNTADITTNATNITTNSTDIATNTTNITTNATNIATNTTDIATNTTNIAAHIALDDDTDDENEIQDLNLTGDILTITTNTGATDINLSGYLDNTDDQTASEVSITDAGGNFTSTDVEGALSELATGSSDDQNISGSGLASNILTIGIENGTSEDVDLSSLDESADVAANAANIATNTTNIANNTADIA